MFKIILIFSALCVILFSCKGKDRSFIPVHFEIQVDSTSVTFNYWMKDMIRYQDGYICLADTYIKSVIFMNKNFVIEEQLTNKMNKDSGKKFNSVWTSGDTLYGMRGYSEYEFCYWKNDQWTSYKKGTMSKENYCSQGLNIPVYEDHEFVVHTCCKGEFGGAVYFHDKKSGKVYSCESTCLASISKIDGAFIISSALPHSTGHSAIKKIPDPRQLYEIKSKKELIDCSWYDIYSDQKDKFTTTHPKGYDKGVEMLIDTLDILILGSFVHENRPYYIYSDMKKSYLGYVKSGKLVTMDTIYPKPMWYGDVRDIMHSKNMFPVRNRFMKGAVFIEGKKIKIIEFKSAKN